MAIFFFQVESRQHSYLLSWWECYYMDSKITQVTCKSFANTITFYRCSVSFSKRCMFTLFFKLKYPFGYLTSVILNLFYVGKKWSLDSGISFESSTSTYASSTSERWSSSENSTNSTWCKYDCLEPRQPLRPCSYYG